MKTRYGKTIIKGCTLQSMRFGGDGVKLICTSVGEHQMTMETPTKDMSVRSRPMVLTQDDLNKSEWDVVSYPSKKHG